MREFLSQTITEIILDILQGGTETTVDLFETMTTNYVESYRRARRGLMGAPGFQFKKRWADVYRRKKSFYSTLSRLKREGFIAKRSGGSQVRWIVTSLGKEKYKKQLEARSKFSWASKPETSAALTIISYDIPETARKERMWLCEILKLLGFTAVHKSVWAGSVKIPKAFLRELDKRGILENVQIFEVTKKGTLLKVI